MSAGRFRALVVAFGITYAWYYALAWNTAKLPEDVRSALGYAGTGALLPLDSPLYKVPFFLALAGSVGLLMLAAWGRALLLLSMLLNLALTPAAGVSVTAPFDAFIGSIAWVLQAFLLGVAYFSPIAERLRAPDATPPGEEAPRIDDGGHPDERIVEVFRSGDQALLAVLESVLIENDLPFSLASESIQDLIAGGRLGGFNFALGPARLFVRERDAEKVRSILRELQGVAPSDLGEPPE